MDATGSQDLKIWLPDGTNYPGQGDIRSRQDRLADSLATIYARLSEEQRLVLEYKIFEPYFYTMDVPGLGHVVRARDRAGGAGVRLPGHGHHAPSTNIEFIVAQLLRLGRLGSFDFNSRFYADDDLIVGAADPFQLFRILFEVVRGGGLEAGSPVRFMLDQCHNIEDKIPGQIRSVLNVQEMTARALLVDREALAVAQDAGDVLTANGLFMDAFYTDVRPALAAWREERGSAGRPDGRLRHVRVRRADRRRAGRRHAGRLGRLRRDVMTTYAAVDLGATSGRVLTGRLSGGQLLTDEVARFENTPVRVPGRRPTGAALGRAVAVVGRPRRARRCAPARRVRLGRRRHLGGRLRPARRGRCPARQPGALPRRTHRRGARTVLRDDARRGALRDHRRPGAAVQHRVPAAVRGRHRPAALRRRAAADP